MLAILGQKGEFSLPVLAVDKFGPFVSLWASAGHFGRYLMEPRGGCDRRAPSGKVRSCPLPDTQSAPPPLPAPELWGQKTALLANLHHGSLPNCSLGYYISTSYSCFLLSRLCKQWMLRQPGLLLFQHVPADGAIDPMQEAEQWICAGGDSLDEEQWHQGHQGHHCHPQEGIWICKQVQAWLGHGKVAVYSTLANPYTSHPPWPR